MLDRAERIDCLATMFRCSFQVAEALESLTIFKVYASRAQILDQGEAIRHCWVVVTGRVQVCSLTADGQQTQLMTFGPGEIFGAFPEGRYGLFEVSAMDDLELFRIEAEKLEAIARTQTEIAFRLAVMFAEQFHLVLDRLAARVTLTANGRVYAELVRQAGTQRLVSPCPSVTSLAMIAQTSRETASRAINALERRGIVRRDANGLEILSPRMLAELLV